MGGARGRGERKTWSEIFRQRPLFEWLLTALLPFTLRVLSMRRKGLPPPPSKCRGNTLAHEPEARSFHASRTFDRYFFFIQTVNFNLSNGNWIFFIQIYISHFPHSIIYKPFDWNPLIPPVIPSLKHVYFPWWNITEFVPFIPSSNPCFSNMFQPRIEIIEIIPSSMTSSLSSSISPW